MNATHAIKMFQRGGQFTPVAGKRPLLAGWTTAPKHDLDTLTGWCEHGDVGLRTGLVSGYCVVDVDASEIPDDLPVTVTARTPRGGYHLYYTAPRYPVGNRVRIRPGLDIRGDGGQVVFVGAADGQYRWMDGRGPDDVPFAPWPEALLPAKLAEAMANVATAPAGQRNDILNRTAHGLAKEGIDPAPLANSSPLPAGETAATLRSAAAAGAKHREEAKQYPALWRPDIVARRFVEQRHRVLYWREVFHVYTGTHYREMSNGELNAELGEFIKAQEWAVKVDEKKPPENAYHHPAHNCLCANARVIPKQADIWGIRFQIQTDHLPDTVMPPLWLTDGPPAHELLCFQNGVMHLPTRRMFNHSDELFTLNAVDYSYAPDAGPPHAWLEFLYEVFEDDNESIDTLQELMGYFLLPDTSQQKIAMLVGPKRGGKGTIARVITGLLGKDNVCSPTLSGLATQFGLWPLINCRLAIISDARLSGRTDQAVVVERLLSISGEDHVSVDRKNLPHWKGRLQTRFLLCTNETPKLTDASGAIASRFILLQLRKSWLGRENIKLTDQLLEERPAIMNWSIAGYDRLRQRGRFQQPSSGRETLQELEDIGSPIMAFIRERCDIGSDLTEDCDQLYTAWQDWCRDNGRDHVGNVQLFGRDVRSAMPELDVIRPRLDDSRVRKYRGLRLKTDLQVRGPSRTTYRYYNGEMS